jgi:putative acetyltransferase
LTNELPETTALPNTGNEERDEREGSAQSGLKSSSSPRPPSSRAFASNEEERNRMSPKIVIRSETDADATAITEVTVAAFKTLEISHHTEQFIIAALRAAKALTVSLVAELDGRVVGHVAFSPVTISDGTRNWYGLGPVSVLPECQRQGIGKALIQEGLSRLKALNAQGCCVVGHPDYYRRPGFKNMRGLVLEGVPQEVFFALSFDGHTPQGAVTFHEAFKADGQQEGAGDASQRAVTVHTPASSEGAGWWAR